MAIEEGGDEVIPICLKRKQEPHIGVDAAKSGLTHSLETTPTNVSFICKEAVRFFVIYPLSWQIK